MTGAAMKIVPYRSVGPIAFGMTVDEVRRTLGDPVTSFMRSPWSKHPCDAYDDTSMFVYYTKDGCVEAMEFASPSSLLLNRFELTTLNYGQLYDVLLQEGDVLEKDGEIKSIPLGIAAFSPDAAKEPNRCAVLESVIVFSKGYYS